MSVVHYLGIVLLLLNAAFLTDNLYSQILQVVVAIVIVIHEIDENKNGRNLSKNIFRKLQAPEDTTINVDTTYASEYDVFGNIFEKINNEKKASQEDKLLVKEAETIIERVTKGWYSAEIKATTSNAELNKLKDFINIMIKATKEHFNDVN
jgi:methyl-accepting chemotaxis protein